MSDKKVDRQSRSSESERPISPSATANRQGADGEPMAPSQTQAGEEAKAEAKTALLDKFREREERVRREQEEAGDQGSPKGGAE